MKNVDQVDRRKNKRVPLDMKVEVCLLSGDMEVDLSIVSCRGRDVSEGGVSFYGTTMYPHESVLRLRFPLSTSQQTEQTDGKELLKVMGKVMWCKKNGTDNSYITGVQFLNIYEEDFQILSEYVQSHPVL